MRPTIQRRLKSTINEATPAGNLAAIETNGAERMNHAIDMTDASTYRAISGLSPLGVVERAGTDLTNAANDSVDRFVDEQLFEEDVRAVLTMMRPHRRERLLGWSEYRTGGAHFRATISWDPSFEQSAQETTDQALSIPRLTDVLESLLVGSVKNQDELHAAEEFEIYRGVVRELHRRLDEMQSCYE